MLQLPEAVEIDIRKRLSKVDLPSGGDFLDVILGSRPFERRVEAMVRRVVALGAESSFRVFIKDNKLLFGTIIYGTRFARDAQDLNMGLLRDEASVKSDSYTDYIEDNKYFSFEEHAKSAAFFHIHPDYSGFSCNDIESFEKEKDMWNEESVRSFAYGLISPVFTKSNGSKGELTGVEILCISGYPSSTEYQAVNLDKLGIAGQALLFARCGFRVEFSRLPYVNGKIDFSKTR